MFMSKMRLNTTIDENLLKLLKEKASSDGLKNINGIIEKALKFYFANLSVSVWEMQCPGGWTRKLIIRPDIVIVENIRSRKSTTKYERAYYTNDEMLIKDGWDRVWRMKSAEKEGAK
jgi:hypothetical protein